MPAKRIVSAVLALLLAVSFAAPSGARADSDAGFEYSVTGTSATVTGCTATCPAALVIPDTLGGYSVTSIGYQAFKNKAITTLTIPSTVTTIDADAFWGNDLTTVTIPNSVTSIGDFAFYGGLSLTTVTIPNSVTSIGEGAFAFHALTTVTIPGSVTIIGNSAFERNALTSVTIPDSVTSIGNSAFEANDLTSVTIPNSVTSIGDDAFENNLLTSVTFLGNAPTEGDEVFDGNFGLTSVTRSSTATGWGATWSDVLVVTDELPPETTLGVTPSSTTSSLVASFEFSGSDNLTLVTFECSVDGGSYVSCASPFSTPTLSVGPHMFAVRAVDAVGNIDLTPASYTWTIESGLPPTNRDGSLWTTTLVILAGLTAAASIALRV